MRQQATVRTAQVVAIFFVLIQIMATAIPIGLNAYPSKTILWLLFFEFSRPFYLLPMIDHDILQPSPWSIIIFFVSMLFFIFADIISRERYMTVPVLTILLTTNVVIMLVMAKGLITGYTYLSITPVSLKILVILVLSFLLYAGIRAIIAQSWRGRLAVVRRLS